MEIPKRYNIKKTGKETLSQWFYLMVLGRALDDRAPNYLKQAIGWSYHAPYAGHDGIQLAIGLDIRPEDRSSFPILQGSVNLYFSRNDCRRNYSQRNIQRQ